MSVEVRSIEGLDKLRERLRDLPKKLRRRALRNALAKGARLVRDEARRIRKQGTGAGGGGKRPTIDLSVYYQHGSVAKAITVRTSKVATRQGDVGVFVNVRPMRGSAAGRKNPNDPYYWHFLEFGTKYFRPGRGAPFLRPATAKLGDALGAIVTELGPQIQKLDTNPDDPL